MHLAQQQCQRECTDNFFFFKFLVAKFCSFFQEANCPADNRDGRPAVRNGLQQLLYHVIPMWQNVTKCHMMWQYVTSTHSHPCVIWCDNMWECVITWAQSCEDCLWFSESLSNHTPPKYLLLIKLNGVDNILKHQMRLFSWETFKRILKLHIFLNFVSEGLVESCDTLSFWNTNCPARQGVVGGDVSWQVTNLSRLLMPAAVTSLISGFSSSLWGYSPPWYRGIPRSFGGILARLGDTFAPSEFLSVNLQIKWTHRQDKVVPIIYLKMCSVQDIFNQGHCCYLQ